MPEQKSQISSRKSRRGFASMSKEKQRQIASLGGRTAHMRGKAHQFSSEEARAAGSKGGQANSQKRKRRKQLV